MMSQLRSVVQVVMGHFTIFQSYEQSGWFVPKILKIYLNLSKLRPKYCHSLFSRHGIHFNSLTAIFIFIIMTLWPAKTCLSVCTCVNKSKSCSSSSWRVDCDFSAEFVCSAKSAKTQRPMALWLLTSVQPDSTILVYHYYLLSLDLGIPKSLTRGQSNLTKSASRGAHSPVRGYPRGSKVVPLNSWGRVSY